MQECNVVQNEQGKERIIINTFHILKQFFFKNQCIRHACKRFMVYKVTKLEEHARIPL